MYSFNLHDLYKFIILSSPFGLPHSTNRDSTPHYLN